MPWSSKLVLIFSVFQGEVGPPGKSGFEGGLGPVGNTGPRGMAVQGKVVSSLKYCMCLCTAAVTMVHTLKIRFLRTKSSMLYFKNNFCLFSCLAFQGPPGARGEKGVPGRPGVQVSSLDLNPPVCHLLLSLQPPALFPCRVYQDLQAQKGKRGSQAPR